MENVMRALYDRTGHVGIWLDENEQWLLDLHGNALAFVHDGSIYDLKGRHVAWWRGDRIQDHHGNVVYVTCDVQYLHTLNVLRRLGPLPPTEKIMPMRPMLGLRPLEPLTSGQWADQQSFLNNLLGTPTLEAALF